MRLCKLLERHASHVLEFMFISFRAHEVEETARPDVDQIPCLGQVVERGRKDIVGGCSIEGQTRYSLCTCRSQQVSLPKHHSAEVEQQTLQWPLQCHQHNSILACQRVEFIIIDHVWPLWQLSLCNDHWRDLPYQDTTTPAHPTS